MTETIVDLAFIGAPSDTASADRWRAEIAFLRRSGKRLLVATLPQEVPARLSARQVLVASQTAAEGLDELAGDARVILRRAGAAAPELARSLSRRLARRVMIAPLDPQERASLAEVLPDRWLTVTDRPPLLQAEPLATAISQPAPSVWRIALESGAKGGLDRRRLLRSLVKAGLDPLRLEIGRRDAKQPPHLLVLAQRPTADEVCRAFEAGTILLLPSSSETATPWPWAPWLRCDAADVPTRIAAVLGSTQQWRQALFDLAGRASDRWADAAFLAGIEADAFNVPAPARGQRLRRDPAPPARKITADLALIGDFRRPDEVNLQALAQIRTHAAAGRQVVLVNVSNGKGGGQIQPGFDALIRLGLAQVLAPCDIATVQTAQVLLPRLTIPALSVMRPAVEAARWLITETEASAPDWDAARLQGEVARLYRAVPDWAAGDATAQQVLSARLARPVAPWPLPAPAPVAAPPQMPEPDGPPVRPVVGVVAYDPADVADLPDLLLTRPEIELQIFLAGHRRSMPRPVPGNCKVLGLEGLDLRAFIDRLDALLVPPDAPFARLPRLAVALAQARGLPVLATPNVAAALAAGLTPVALPDWPEALSGLRGGALVPRATARDEAEFAAALGLQGPPLAAPPAAAAVPRILFVTANGVGLGHVTRLAAIARRLPPTIEPIFATMSQAASVLKDMGYFCELLTGYSGRPAEAWRASLRERMIGILDQHRPAAVVLDSSNPYPGILEAVACRPGVRLIWIRRGMWRATQENADFLTRAPYFDRIIEPQDIAEVNDTAPLLPPRVVRVPPIGLLDEAELLPQRAARLALGLPEMPPPGGSVLVQLGSGTTRDLDTLLDTVLARLHDVPDLEIVLAQWLNSASAYDARWPGVQILSGYPIPRYYRAFDFTISAAGYNSFNDLLRFGLPTIFVANDAQCMDDQGARARFAEQAEAAFDVQETDLSILGDCIAAILQPQVRAFLQDRSRAIALPNGAQAAAQAILETLQ